MLQRLLLTGFVCALFAAEAAADSLDVQLFPLSGEVRFHNPNATAVAFVYYSISSITAHSGALNPTNPPWQSISDVYPVWSIGQISRLILNKTRNQLR
jgi:hypothetical protein